MLGLLVSFALMSFIPYMSYENKGPTIASVQQDGMVGEANQEDTPKISVYMDYTYTVETPAPIVKCNHKTDTVYKKIPWDLKIATDTKLIDVQPYSDLMAQRIEDTMQNIDVNLLKDKGLNRDIHIAMND